MNKYLTLSSDDGEGNEWLENLWNKLKWGIITIAIIWPFFPEFFPYHPIKDFWVIKGNVMEWIYTCRYLFLWAASVNFIIFIYRFGPRYGEDSPAEILKDGFKTSFFAGVWEEIAFRWIIFLGAMVTVYLANWVLGGFNGSDHGLIRWFNNNVQAPVADFFTLGYLHTQLVQSRWYVGAAIIISNSLFRDGHQYQGWLGYINSWFIGIFLFYIMFHYGLPAAILIHFLYDIVCYGMRAIECLIYKAYAKFALRY